MLTIIGAYPTFAFEQVDALLRGVDLTAHYRLNKTISFDFKGSMLRAINRTNREFLVLMPADRFETGFTLDFKDFNKFKKNYATFSVQHVFEQTRVPENSDFAPPPPAFTLINAYLGTEIMFKTTPIQLSISVTNLLNTSYRDYLNRFRYYTDNLGRNVMFNCQIPLHFGGQQEPNEINLINQ